MSSVHRALTYINSLPIPLTINHYFVFDQTTSFLKDGELHSAESWDTLRQSHPHFSISENREEWLKATRGEIKKDGQDSDVVKRSKDIVKIIDELGVTSVFSAGVGGAGLEYHIKKARPNIRLTCSEYSPENVSRLKKVFLEADSILYFDMKSSDWSVALNNVEAKKQLTLLYRIDIDFTDEELRAVFEHMYDSGIEHVLIVLCGYLSLRGLYNRLRQRLSWKLKGTTYSFSGHLRTKKRFQQFWRDFYADSELECAGMKTFLLRKIQKK